MKRFEDLGPATILAFNIRGAFIPLGKKREFVYLMNGFQLEEERLVDELSELPRVSQIAAVEREGRIEITTTRLEDALLERHWESVDADRRYDKFPVEPSHTILLLAGDKRALVSGDAWLQFEEHYLLTFGGYTREHFEERHRQSAPASANPQYVVIFTPSELRAVIQWPDPDRSVSDAG